MASNQSLPGGLMGMTLGLLGAGPAGNNPYLESQREYDRVMQAMMHGQYSASAQQGIPPPVNPVLLLLG